MYIKEVKIEPSIDFSMAQIDETFVPMSQLGSASNYSILSLLDLSHHWRENYKNLDLKKKK